MGTSKDNLIQRTTELEGNLMEEQAKSIEYENRYNQLLEENKDFEEQLRIAKDDLKFCRNKNKNLEDQLKSKVTYIHETSHLYCSDGEMHIQYGDCDNENWVVYNTDQLFKDLPFIINQVVKENKKMQSYYLGQIKKELLDLMVEGEDKYMDIDEQAINDPKDI
jgi:chromosome segregation ATPase